MAPNTTSQIVTITQYMFLEYLRSRRFTILLAIVLSVSAILVGVTVAVGLSIFFIWGSFAPIIAILAAVFFGADAISGEFQNRTGYFSLTNPVSRETVYAGKWLATYLASAIILSIFTAITTAVGLATGGIMLEFILSFMFALFFLAAAVGFTFLCSSLFKNTTNSIFVAAMLLLVAFTAITNLTGLIQLEPWFMLNYAGGIIGNILTVPYPPNSVSGVDLGKGLHGTTYAVTVPEGLIIIATYFTVTTIIGLLLFKKKEFN